MSNKTQKRLRNWIKAIKSAKEFDIQDSSKCANAIASERFKNVEHLCGMEWEDDSPVLEHNARFFGLTLTQYVEIVHPTNNEGFDKYVSKSETIKAIKPHLI